MGRIETAVRSMSNLHQAWAAVRSNVNASGQDKFKAEVQRISKNPFPHLKRIQSQLQRRRFIFEKQHGVLKTKSTGGKRPIVVAPIRHRIVQRAILDILQSEDGKIASLLGEIRDAVQTRTSVGGIRRRGVEYGINLVTDAIKGGATHYLRSDIRDFFTKVPKSRVTNFVRAQTRDDGFTELLEKAMATELDNVDEIKEYRHLFPLGDIGVPQGSSLSTFAGNVILRDFDAQLNERNITTIRYVDDFVILGTSERAVRKAFSSAASILEKLGMTAYGPDENPEKSKLGNTNSGFDFLGCSIQGNRVTPSKKSRKKLLDDVRQTLGAGAQAVKTHALSGKARRAEETFAQALCRVDRQIRGWGDSVSFSNDRLPFAQMDQEIDHLLLEFKGRANQAIKKAASQDGKRRALGVALLKDTPRVPKGEEAQPD